MNCWTRLLLSIFLPLEVKIFAEQPYLANVYPGKTREIGMVFCINEGSIEYFNLGVRPIFRERYTFGTSPSAEPPKGYQITQACISCGTCFEHCPVQALQRLG